MGDSTLGKSSFPARTAEGGPDQPKSQPLVDHAQSHCEAIELFRQGRLPEAEQIYRELIDSGIESHEIYRNLAAICLKQGKHDQIVRLLGRVLHYQPDDAVAHLNLGHALLQEGRLTDAIASYQSAIKYRRDFPEAFYFLANALRDQGDLGPAVLNYQKAIQLKPDFPEAYNNMGIILQQQGNTPSAIECFLASLKINPSFPNACFNLGKVYTDQGELLAATQYFQKALIANPGYSDAHNGLGNALYLQGRLDESLQSYTKALEFNPRDAEAANNIGNIMHEQGAVSDAVDFYGKTLSIAPQYAHAYNNLGNALHQLGRLSDAMDAFGKALSLNPSFAKARYNLSMVNLLLGDYQAGWDLYEERLQANGSLNILLSVPSCTQWDGREPSAVDLPQLLVVSEQGLGDTLQFMRYLPVLRQMGISVAFCAQPKLHHLIQVSGLDLSPLTPEEAVQVKNGYWMPLMSVPHLLRVSPENPVIAEPYIKTTDELTVKWRENFSAYNRPIIGINWQGNPDHEKMGSVGRSLPLEAFAPIASSSEALFVSLQKGFGSEQLDSCSFRNRFVPCQHEIDDIWDFLEIAAIISNCDLIVTSDTSVAHLAGGMGKPTWLLLKQIPEWRWGLDDEETFWYPSMRLFRQRTHGDWNEVTQRVAAELRSIFA